MEMVNPLAAYREGWQTSQGLFDQRTQRQAGNALAQGDYRGGANALLQGGMLDEGMQMQAFDQKRQAQAQEQERAMQEQAKGAQVQSLKTMLGGAQSLLQVQGATPEEIAANRKQVYQTQVRPLLEQQGVPPELLAKFDTSGFTDQELQPFVTTLGGELQKPEWQIVTPGNGQRPYAIQKGNPGSFQYVGPEVTGPQGEWKAEGGNMWFYPADGSEPRKGPALTPTPRTYAPPRARSGGGRGGSGGGYSDIPAGAVVVR
jgi:hypothetical protein